MNCSAMNSGPLSSRIAWGYPRQLTTCFTLPAGSRAPPRATYPFRWPTPPHVFIQHIRRPGPSVAVKRIAHEIDHPDGVRLRDHSQRLAQLNRQPLMIPAMPVEPESITTFPKFPSTLGRDEHRQRRNYRRIAPGPGHQRPVVRRPAAMRRNGIWPWSTSPTGGPRRSLLRPMGSVNGSTRPC